MRYRHEFYESDEKVTLSVFDKGVNADDVKVEFGDRSVSLLSFNVATPPIVAPLSIHPYSPTRPLAGKLQSRREIPRSLPSQRADRPGEE